MQTILKPFNLRGRDWIPGDNPTLIPMADRTILIDEGFLSKEEPVAKPEPKQEPDEKKGKK